jgi:dimethylargininase
MWGSDTVLTALTRQVSPHISDCLLENLPRQEIDAAKAARQHREYEACLAGLGVQIVRVPDAPECPDGVFVEDPAVALDEAAVILPMGTETRRKEVASVAETLSGFRPLIHLKPPAMLEGGDVMRIGKTLFVGMSVRSNQEGIEGFAAAVAPFGYTVQPVRVNGCMHLKSGCCYAGAGTVVANRGWVDIAPFRQFRVIDVPADEPRAADVLAIGDGVLMPSCFPGTRRLLEQRGFGVQALDVSELMKAEAAVTCMSIIFESDRPKPAAPISNAESPGR